MSRACARSRKPPRSFRGFLAECRNSETDPDADILNLAFMPDHLAVANLATTSPEHHHNPFAVGPNCGRYPLVSAQHPAHRQFVTVTKMAIQNG
jgi:hypothetical protein